MTQHTGDGPAAVAQPSASVAPAQPARDVITIRHTRQQGTLVFGTSRRDNSAAVLRQSNFRPSEWLPADDLLGQPYWYQPHSRRRSAKQWVINTVRAALEELGLTVEVTIDNVTPATGFSDLEQDRYERADARAARYESRARAADSESESIRAANDRTYDALANTPILIGHHSEQRHRNLLDRLWKRDGKAWELYRLAKLWRERQVAAERHQHRREDVGVTQRRIAKLEARLREIGREMDGRLELLHHAPDGAGTLDDQIAQWRAKAVGVEVQSRNERTAVLVVGPSGQRKAELVAEVIEIAEEISYWELVIERSGAKVWTRADFAKCDFVTDGTTWYEVARANAKSLSVPGRFDFDAGPVRTLAAQRLRYRGQTVATQPLPYDRVRGRLSAAEARERFPAAFAAVAEHERVPERPAKKRGKVRLEHSPGAVGENWYFECGGKRYRAHWRHPEGWFSKAPAEPCTGDIPPVRVYERSVLIGRNDTPTGDEVVVPAPLHYVEQVHNLVRAFVEELAKRVAAEQVAGDS